MSEIHAGRNNFSRGISTSWRDKEHIRHPQKNSFFFQTTIISFSFYGSATSPSWKYSDSSCTKGGPIIIIILSDTPVINLIGACSSWYDPKNHEHGTAWNTCFPGGNSGFQVTGMIEWEQKSKPKKIPRASKEPKNSLDQKLTPQNPMPKFRASKISRKD